MRYRALRLDTVGSCRQRPGRLFRRTVHISATPTSESLGELGQSSFDPTDASFEVLGAPYSILSVSLSASQNLYTRRGTLIGVGGNSENTRSTLSITEPFRRSLLGIPFLYQKVSSTSPIVALISTKSPITSFTVLHLDGTRDWMVAQRNALLAWTGHSLSLAPTLTPGMGIAHWGNTKATGRGLMALVGPGSMYQIRLKPGEEYVAHPANVVAYTITPRPPQPYRFPTARRRGVTLTFPALTAWLPEMKPLHTLRQSEIWRLFARAISSLNVRLRRTLWGDQTFLRFHGPMTILISSRVSRVTDVLTARDLSEMADVPSGKAPSVSSVEKNKDEALV
ncbi:Altered inheritance of mitochondria protein 24 [Podosphaera aphanis]|nr:Altered inheritance of mitochondria protein 24 [Podosphaera aphanis]